MAASPIAINVPTGLTYVVSITGGTVYTDSTLGTAVTFPQTITATTLYYSNGPATYTLSCKFNGVELSGVPVTANGYDFGVSVSPTPTTAQLARIDTPVEAVLVASGDTTGAADTAAINAAITSLPSSGGVVVFGPGSFYTNATIIISKPVILTGQGAAVDWNNGSDAPWQPSTQIIRASGTGAMFQITGPTGPVRFERMAFDCANLAVSGVIADRWQGGGARDFSVRRSTGYCLDLSNASATSAINNMGLQFTAVYLRGGGLVRLTGASGTPAIANTTHNTFQRIIGLQSGQNDRTLTDASIAGNIITSASANFTAADVGLTVFSTGGTLGTRIASVTDASHATVDVAGTISATTITVATAGIHFEDSDNNDWHGVYLFRETSGKGFGVWFGPYARSNYFYHLETNGGVYASLPGVASYANVIWGYDQDNNQPTPTLAAGANLTFTTDGQNSTGWYGLKLRYPTLYNNSGGTSANALQFNDVNTGKKMYMRGQGGSGGINFLNNAFTTVIAGLSDGGLFNTVGPVQPGNGTASGGHLYSGSGAPNIAASVSGDYYLRTDTPSTANQRIYVATGANTWTGIL